MNTSLSTRIKTAVGLAFIAVVTCAAAWRVASAVDQPRTGAEVRIDNFTFQAQTVTVATGTEVTWVNRDDIPHTVVSEDHAFKSKALDTDDKFSYTFTKPGTYKYFCSLHPKMTAEIVVK